MVEISPEIITNKLEIDSNYPPVNEEVEKLK